MDNQIKTSITFYINPAFEPIDAENMTEEELVQYAKEAFVTDITNLANDNDLIDYVNVEFVND
jgi:hypothetical protein